MTKTKKKNYKTNLKSKKKSQNRRNDQAKIKRIFLRRYQSFIYSNVMKRLLITQASRKTRRRNRRRRFKSEKQAHRARPGQIPARRPHSRVSSAPAGRTTPSVRKVSAGWPDRWASLRENPTGATRTGGRPT